MKKEKITNLNHPVGVACHATQNKQSCVGAGPVSAQNAITLVALVITVIILLILAGVTINLTLGNNGIFSTAQKAAKNYTEAQNKELANLNEFENIVDKVTQAPAYNPSLLQLKPGDYVKYDTGVKEVGDNGVATFRVLYDATSEYGLQIISAKSIKAEKLGGDDWITGSTSYNNVITALNEKAEQYINPVYAKDARCVGSNPKNKNTEEKETVELKFATSVEGANNMKAQDNNYETDWNAMNISDMYKIEEHYWLASRLVFSDSSDCSFNVRDVQPSGKLGGYAHFCKVSSDGQASGNSPAIGLRPCIVLKPDITITSGDGTSEATAYTLGI